MSRILVALALLALPGAACSDVEAPPFFAEQAGDGETPRG